MPVSWGWLERLFFLCPQAERGEPCGRTIKPITSGERNTELEANKTETCHIPLPLRLARTALIYHMNVVFCAERGSERSRADTKERLQYLAAGTAGTRTAQDAGYGAVTNGAAG